MGIFLGIVLLILSERAIMGAMGTRKSENDRPGLRRTTVGKKKKGTLAQVREEIYTRPSAKATSAVKRLHHYLNIAADREGRPMGHEDSFEAHTDGFPMPRAIDDEEFLRLKFWLQYFADNNDSEVYAAFLQVWLASHEIPWPAGLFSSRFDFSLPGPGAPRKNDQLGAAAKRMRAKGEKWDAVAAKHKPARYQNTSSKKKAADLVRQAAKRSRPMIDLGLKALGHRMLGTMMPEEEAEILVEYQPKRAPTHKPAPIQK